MIDSHCHIHYLPDTASEVIDQAKKAGVSRILNVAVTEKEWDDNIKMGQSGFVDVGLGVHPCDVQHAQKGWQDRLLSAASDSSVVAIGETGLDYYHDKNFVQLQKSAFVDHIAIAQSLNKPVIIHMREASQDTISLLKEHRNVRGVIHCFTENWPIAKQLLDCGMLISFSGIVTFKNARAIQEAAMKVPLDQMLIETDAPYLAPVPYRGKQNYPHYVMYVAQQIAELRACSVEEVIEQTAKNYLSWIQP
ncbi:TatD family hydrolase [Candidatus Comchoanobacter bicostacola]|uniref:TatD family hydrolase n=1 Tax=Candidatus Comchoanobacter bicostacola TaxID=2919598 RepID=A0ABY5DJ03_9GAMM|nr:TatD family hydrolase [Candidatus Comchoanobacter bicostacola]UTC24543.1 TatD family hydrolase [Candidatus Comchoanobacter bicostacola]